MESQFNLAFDANVELELIQVDFYGLLDLLDHYQIPGSKRKRISQKVLGQPKKSDGLNRQLHQSKISYHERLFIESRKLNKEDCSLIL